ncbi:S1/P1 nuclease [Hymenobacter rigui]|uniref:S1/P1 Nuclease n=1 Tax=Hymenobacter rigui TaxID=334424 RepID=A0A428K9N1_9BACT|nr:S1/P1 nuclease [Hymenobacter rigui]RSK43174.1 hypothetical protein EI291_22205 [Hymenobacter rigui]
MKTLVRLAALYLFAVPLPAKAWNMVGHRVIGQIAANHLLPHTREEIGRLLGTESLALASTWADDYRETPTGKASANWHFVNAPAGLNHAQYSVFLQNTPTGVQTLYTEFPRLLAELRNPATSAIQRKQALRLIVHLVGDAHQPLHAGRAADKGGNLINLVLRKDTVSLHKYWDRDMVEYAGLSYQELATACDHASDREVSQWSKSPIEEWLFESYQLCEPIYHAAENPDFLVLYYDQQLVVRQRLLQAGVRLAALLSNTFSLK